MRPAGESLIELPEILLPGSRGNGGGGVSHVMGVDGGATKTLAAVLDVEGGRLHLGHGGPSNQDSVGVEAAVEAVLMAAGEACGQAGIELEQLDGAVLAIAGTDTESVAGHLEKGAQARWTVVNDVVGAWAAATGGRPGVGAIAGTGSNVLAVGRDGGAWRAGGWGHILGDEGSGYWLGVRSIAAALGDRDASGPRTALSEVALEFFEVESLQALVSLVYSKPLSKSEIAAFAIETGRVAEQGDEVARELYMEGAEELGKRIGAAIGQTGLDGEFPIGLIGSAFKAGEVFVGPLREAVRAQAPSAKVEVVGMEPVGGALILAQRACGVEDAIGSKRLERLIEATLAPAPRS